MIEKYGVGMADSIRNAKIAKPRPGSIISYLTDEPIDVDQSDGVLILDCVSSIDIVGGGAIRRASKVLLIAW